jgi:5-methylcytosine-specific restriction endonuclease McrA
VLDEERRCWKCGEPATTVDHVVPLRDGGRNERSNLRAACRRCNFGWASGERAFPRPRKNEIAIDDTGPLVA